MRTKKITLYYSVTQTQVIPPGPGELQKKEKWLEMLKSTVKSDWEPKTVRVTYQEYNPEVDQQRKFMNGPVLEYWIIQSQDILDGDVSPELKRKGRETLLDRTLGYDIELLEGKARRRRSTTDFEDTQQWHDFLEMLKETEFDPNGYEFPESEYFWKLAEGYGYEKAKEVAIKKLQEKMKLKQADSLSTPYADK